MEFLVDFLGKLFHIVVGDVSLMIMFGVLCFTAIWIISNRKNKRL